MLILIRKQDEKRILFVFIFYILFSFPIFLANVYYNDDDARALYGATWSKNGRIFSTALMNLLDLRFKNILDLSPLGQILGLLVLAYAAVRFTQRATQSTQPSYFALCMCGLPLAIQPFFLQNLSYKFDSLTMLMAQALAVFACVLPAQWSKKRKFSACFMLLIGVMGFYQTGVNTFLALSLLIFLCDYQYDNTLKTWGDLGIKIAAFFVAALLYKELIIPATIHGQFERHLAVTLDWKTLSFHVFSDNITNILVLVSSLLTQGAKPLLLGLYSFATLGSFVAGVQYFCRKNLSDVCVGILCCMLPFINLCLLSGMLLMLKNVEYVPRVLTSFSACIIFVNLFFMKSFLRKIRWIAFIPISYFFVVSYSYGNLLAENSRFELYHIQRVASALKDAGFHSGDNLFLYGNEPLSPIVENAVKAMPILDHLRPDPAIQDDEYFGYVILRSRGIDGKEHTAQAWVDARGCLNRANQVYVTADFMVFRNDRTFCVKEQNGGY
ncbi:glucosyltransferase domain-containing protein [Acetobacter sp.]|uniref:glucosyltransferase domain-containing protein n=1 Tax=Acetobacter sp. TaxID=440 RepID=UPI0039E89AF0